MLQVSDDDLDKFPDLHLSFGSATCLEMKAVKVSSLLVSRFIQKVCSRALCAAAPAEKK